MSCRSATPTVAAKRPLFVEPRIVPPWFKMPVVFWGVSVMYWTGSSRPFVALDEADAVVAELPAGFGRAADDRIEAGAVAAAGENADSFGVHLPPPLDWCAAKTSHRKLRAWAAAQRLSVKRSRARSSIQSARLTQSILAAQKAVK